VSDEKKESWEMPKPVFKSSEGSLPRSLEETISQSFMANAETLEIDEDDDILGIMDTLPGNVPIQPGDFDDEVILETGPAEESKSVPEAAANSDEPTVQTANSQPISVSAKETVERAEAKSGSSFMFIMIALVAAIVAILLYYVSTNKQ
jgi:hypothetical protein